MEGTMRIAPGSERGGFQARRQQLNDPQGQEAGRTGNDKKNDIASRPLEEVTGRRADPIPPTAPAIPPSPVTEPTASLEKRPEGKVKMLADQA
jgi:hypothetical protein